MLKRIVNGLAQTLAGENIKNVSLFDFQALQL